MKLTAKPVLKAILINAQNMAVEGGVMNRIVKPVPQTKLINV